MKTFDGNPLEHSPASAHTDHAIAGYDYKVEVDLKDGGVKILETTVESTFKWHPDIYAQMDGNWTISLSYLNYNDLIDFFKVLKHDGFTGVGLDLHYYMNTPHDNSPYELKTRDPQIANWGIRTQTMDELATVLKALEQVGLEAANVRGSLDISKAYQDMHGFSGNGYIEPTNPSQFFDNYTNLWLGLVPILNEYDVKLITPFVECDKLEKYSHLIKEMYTRLSEDFHGELGFDEATNNMLEGHSTINSTPIRSSSDFARLVGNFNFWDWQDSQGRPMKMEYSVWNFVMETQSDQRVAVIERMFKQLWSLPLYYYHSKWPNNPQMFGEIGARNADGYVLGPDYFYAIPQSQRELDEQERADVIYSILKASKDLGIDTVGLWTIPLGDLWAGNTWDNYFLTIGLRNPISPAYRVIKAVINSN